MKPAADKTGDRRDAILHSAGTIFFERGFDRASIDAVAAQARLSKQTIYEFFPSKTALFEAVVRATLSAGRTRVESIEPDLAAPQASLERFATHMFARFVDPTNLGLLRASIVATRRMPDLAADLHRQRLGAVDAIGRFVEQLADAGTLQTHNPMRAGIRLGGTSSEGSRYLLGFPMPSGAARAALIAANVGLYLHGYRAAPMDEDLALPAPEHFVKPEPGQQAAIRLSHEKLAGLLHAAEAEFLARGYTGASMDRIASTTGVSKSTIHRQFVDKEGLFRHIVRARIHAIAKEQPGVIPSGDVCADVTALAARALEAHLAPERIALHHLMIEEAAMFGDLARCFYDAQIAARAAALSPILAAGGWPQPGAQAVRAFHTLATFGVRFLTAAAAPDRREQDDLSSEAARIFLFGLARRPTS